MASVENLENIIVIVMNVGLKNNPNILVRIVDNVVVEANDNMSIIPQKEMRQGRFKDLEAEFVKIMPREDEKLRETENKSTTIIFCNKKCSSSTPKNKPLEVIYN